MMLIGKCYLTGFQQFAFALQNAQQRVFGDPNKTSKDEPAAGKGKKKGTYMTYMYACQFKVRVLLRWSQFKVRV